MVRQRYDDALLAYTAGTLHAERAGDAVQHTKTLSNSARQAAGRRFYYGPVRTSFRGMGPLPTG